MTSACASAAQILRRVVRGTRAWRDDARATAAVEAALILPVALAWFALLIYGAQAFSIQRKVTLTTRTVTDLVTQYAPKNMTGGASIMLHATIDNLLCVASAVIQPYDNTNMTMVVSEVLVNSDQATAAVQWSEPYNGGTARAYHQTITLPIGLGAGQAGSYLVLGEVTYNYTPINIFPPAAALNLHDAIYLTPRQSTSISCTDCTTHGP
jgi:Flp pilus assembly protein TadG